MIGPASNADHPMRLLGNILWHIPFLGFLSAIYMLFLGVFFTLTIVGAPLGAGLFELGRFYLAPFGNRLVNASDLGTPLSQNPVWVGWGWLVTLCWLPFGLIACFILVFQALGLCLTIIGIPPGIAIFRSLETILNPVGKTVISSNLKMEMTRRHMH
jgi:uncharacterized membrane protein YccF (DUF307 family)